MTQQQVMRDLECRRQAFNPRGKDPCFMTEDRDDPGFVVGRDAGDAITKTARHALCILDKTEDGFAAFPAAFFLKGLG